MNVGKILKSVKSEISSFLDEKRKERDNPKKALGNTMDKFVKSNAYDLMDVKAKTRYVNGVYYGNGT
ncbi:MAG: hypothetical protein U0457_05645 [Candidatus Sericytochromatia bacterium]